MSMQLWKGTCISSISSCDKLFDLLLLPLASSILFNFPSHQGVAFFFVLLLSYPLFVLQGHHQEDKFFLECAEFS